MPVQPDDVALLEALTPEAERLMERHLAASKEWFPHEFVPWSLGRDFVPGEEWAPDDEKMPPAVRSALVVNLLTEDNLPYYSHTISGCSATTTSGARGPSAGRPKRAATRS